MRKFFVGLCAAAMLVGVSGAVVAQSSAIDKTPIQIAQASTTGKMTKGKMTSGKMTKGKMSSGKMTKGKMSSGKMTKGKMSSGKMTKGKMTKGK